MQLREAGIIGSGFVLHTLGFGLRKTPFYMSTRSLDHKQMVCCWPYEKNELC